MSEEAINEAATLQCDCDAAQLYQQVKQKETYAEANIKKLFENDGEQMQETLLQIVPALAWRRLTKVTITSQEGIKATLTAKERSIRVERTETNKSTLEN